MQADAGRLLRAVGCALVVPCRPGGAAPWHHAGVGVQYGAVGLVADGAQHLLLGGAGPRQQAQGLVAVYGQHHGIEVLHAAASADEYTGGIALDALYRGLQPRIQAVQEGMHILPRPARHGVPLRPVLHLDQAVVVAKAHHGGHGKAQHLVGRAAPDTAQHGQEIPVAKRRAKAVLVQKLTQRLGQRLLLATVGQRGAQAIEAQQLRQHPQKARAQQVAPLGKHGGQAGAAPLQRPGAQRARARHLDGKRHVRRGRGHLQLVQQRDQAGVGALVEHQKAGVHPVRHGLAMRIGQGHIHGVGVAAEVATRLEQRDPRLPAQPVCGRQARNARSNDCDFHGLFRSVMLARAARLRCSCGVMY